MEPFALVVIFLRGGADGLALIPPYADPALLELRPTLASPLPDDTRVPKARRVVDIDGRFGLHPALAPLSPMLAAGELAVVHAVGSDDDTRSHFEAQDRMERAGLTATSSASGWLARHLSTRPGAPVGPLGAIAFGSILPESIRGHSATALSELSEMIASTLDDETLDRLARLYAPTVSLDRLPLEAELRAAGRDAISVSRELSRIARGARSEVGFPSSTLGRQLSDAALLLRHRRELGVEIVTLDHGGWDTHFVQTEILQEKAADLASSLSAFRSAMADDWSRTTVVVLTEFGRRCHENVSLGTDHGRASVAFVAGGRLTRGGVFGAWRGLTEEALEGPGDLRVLTDYRVLLSEVVEHALQNPRVADVLPGLDATSRLGLFARG